MNRYAEIGLAADAKKGKRIICVLPRPEVRPAMEGVSAIGGDDVSRVCRANGAERVEFASGGSVHFVTGRHSLRGMTADVVFLASERDGNDPETVESARLVVLSTGGGVIRP